MSDLHFGINLFFASGLISATIFGCIYALCSCIDSNTKKIVEAINKLKDK